ncbi:hypothetical protein PHYSODRAFT_301648 [Phytophthora sojae]|uniref:Uncharacterized protein n=1 Tax=Phytophthora sojae (strain P6497) TaxID=1094619 RepID=G4ZK38_PHYSP|nr:hypothetical protein PHYSODRAFT_301648 [Phytophthora sojae]EGZ14842.1 hypothetical protein PHYSODRAFT_301648 [Phytophthora sojae]|eukprot:XP_009528591.1 hypothetical protein PHYSODRAFT_301648 [Phytophthora sojae]
MHPDQHSRFEVGSASFWTNEYMEVNPPELVSFWSVCAKDSTQIDQDTVLNLPEGAYLLGDPTLGSKVFLRRCYSKLLDIGMKTLDKDVKSYPQLLILGNSGVGKTFFGFVLLRFLARSGATFVYESASMGDRILFAPGLVVRGSDQDFANILRTPTTYYISDGGKPSHNPCMTVWLTTPQYSVSCLFGRVNALYMPTWSKEEILKCHESLYSSNIPIKKVEECYQRWGGIPRYVLHLAQSDSHQRLLQEAIGSISLNSLIGACVKFMQDDYYELHGLLYYRVNECYGKESFVFASRYVQQEVYKHLYRHDKDDLLWFLGKSHVGALATLHSLLVSKVTSGG